MIRIQRVFVEKMQQRDVRGALTRMNFEIPQRPEFFMGGGGSYSTAADYLIVSVPGRYSPIPRQDSASSPFPHETIRTTTPRAGDTGVDDNPKCSVRRRSSFAALRSRAIGDIDQELKDHGPSPLGQLLSTRARKSPLGIRLLSNPLQTESTPGHWGCSSHQILRRVPK